MSLGYRPTGEALVRTLPVPKDRTARILRIREGPAGAVVLAAAVGVGAGCGAIVFRWLVTTATRFFSGHHDYAAVGPAAHPGLPWLGRWFVLLVPVAGGLLYGPLVHTFAREARGHGVPEVMAAVAERGGRIRPQVAVVKALASALCIGSGGSVGREGPIVQVGAALGSTAGRLLRAPESRLRMLVACGAAGGIAATFNAPLAGVFFALELILGNFAVESFGPVVLASVAASIVGRAAFGSAAFLRLPQFTVRSPVEYALFALLGLLAGVVGATFVRVLYGVEDVCDRLWRGPEWLRPAAGGLLLGGLLLALPPLYGVGYPVLERAIGGGYVVWFLLLLLAGKMLATSLTVGIGGSGGVFAPSLFLGALLGSAVGQVASHLAPSSVGSVGAYGLVGMGAVFAGAARAPITAVVILFELTGEYSIILPLMAAIVLATLVSRLLSKDTIYSAKLRRRGLDLDRHRAGGALTSARVAAVMEPLPAALPVDTSLADATPRLVASPHGLLPVVDGDGRYVGVVTARAVAEARQDDPAGGTRATVADLVELPVTVAARADVAAAVHALVAAGTSGLPVLDRTDGERLVGWVTAGSVLSLVGAGIPEDDLPERTRPRRGTSPHEPDHETDQGGRMSPTGTWTARGLRALARAPIVLYRLRLGFLLGHRLLLVQHTGRVTGRSHLVVLEVVARPGPGRYVVAAGLGARSDWYRNVIATPAVRVSVGKERGVPGRATALSQDRSVAVLDGYGREHRLAWRVLAPLLGRLLGAASTTAGEFSQRIPLVELDLRSECHGSGG